MSPSAGDGARTGCCAPSRPATEPAPGPTRGGGAEGLVSIPEGSFDMGYEGPLANPGEGEGPVRRQHLSSYRIGEATVTNRQYAAFVEATGHVTQTERDDWSFVFDALVSDPSAVRGRVVGAEWWCAVAGASWRQPYGPGSSVQQLTDHPVVHVTAHDAEAYCAWTGTRLPTETEWERAARGGIEGAVYPWGDELLPGGTPRCNIWQGDFPRTHTGEGGQLGTAPVRSYPPNGFGLYQAVGNVWEWTSTPNDIKRVRRGGSYLCHDSYCNRYRVAARDSSLPGDATGNIGFRVAVSGAKE
ncbi:MAG: Sulfatase modifying factor 1 precursor [Frankiales bacterium]|nr:Sulfatase modifying factor 1 precursor [Frankiales bacterium]